jgi:putative OmpL-like beta-barrel porin-2
VSRWLLPCLMAIVVTVPVTRAEEPAKEAAKPPPPPKWYDTFELHGLVDTYYSANVNQVQRDLNPLRVFDASNGFELSYAKLTAQVAPTTTYTAGFHADVGFGQTASALLFNPTPSVGDVVVQQAYVSVKLPEELVLDAGKFVTNTGAEVIEAKDNWLYSRSLLFGFAIPFTHTGLRATIPIPGAAGFSVMASIFNGWDNPPKQVGSQKMGHLALIYSGPSNTAATLNVMYGRNPSEPDDRLLLDAVAARSFGDLSLNVNADYGSVGSSSYWGVAVMARYSLFGDRCRVSIRGEYLDDSDALQVTSPGNKYYEGTLGASLPVGGNAEFRIEARHDHLNSGTLATGSSGQTTFQVAALAWF